MMKKITLLSLLVLFAATSFVSAEGVVRKGSHCGKESCEKESLEKCCESVKKTLCDVDRGTNKANCKLDDIKEKLLQIVGDCCLTSECESEVDCPSLCSLTSQVDAIVEAIVSQLVG